MCGITGYIDLLRSGANYDQVLGKMTHAIKHRGPDSKGFFVGLDAGLGIQRLSIIDLETGDQPLFNEDKSLVLLCNGEIYNYRELRDLLLQKGHHLRTKSDVEVVVHLFEEYGPDCVHKLNGQFAFIIYDTRSHQALIARDHFGICPLFYTVVNGLLVFGSEIKAILEHPLVPRAVDLTGLDQVFSLPGLISPRTMFAGIQSLPPGHLMEVKDGQLAVREYWDLVYPLQEHIQDEHSGVDYPSRLRELLERSVRYRLQADVPVGFFLSGGLDSSLIGAIIRSVSPGGERHSFSIAFTDARISESCDQQLMATHLGTVHHEIQFSEEDVASRLFKAVYHAECPLKESYNTASLALSMATRQSGVSVVLNGEGSDELFAGYVGHKLDRRVRSQETNLDAFLGSELREALWGDPNLFYEKDDYAFRDTKFQLYSDAVGSQLANRELGQYPVINKERLRGRHPIHKRCYLDFKLRLAGHLIADHGDRMAMANSVEARYPFLDIDLVEFCRTIPPDMLLRDSREKAVLKDAARGLLPDRIVEREKFPFVGPGSPALLRRNIEWINDTLSYESIKRQGYFNPHAVEILKRKSLQNNGGVQHAFEDDLLMVVLTFGLFIESYRLPGMF